MPNMSTLTINGVAYNIHDSRVQESTDNAGCYYRIVGGATEWINPPMQFGVEYRTTERYDNKPVYTKIIDFGALPDSGNKSAVFCSTGADLVGLEFRVKNSGGTLQQVLPFITQGVELRTHVHTTKYSIFVYTLSTLSGYSGTVTVRYVKD